MKSRGMLFPVRVEDLGVTWQVVILPDGSKPVLF